MAEETDPFDNDTDKDWFHSDARAALYAALVEGDIPLKAATTEDEDVLWGYFNVRAEVHNYGGFEKDFR